MCSFTKKRMTVQSHDLGYLHGDVSRDLRSAIVEKGSEFLHNVNSAFPNFRSKGKCRLLTQFWFEDQLPSGEKITRSWLIYSRLLQSLFCFPCLLFSDSPENMKSYLETIRVGFSNWKKSNKTQDHCRAI